MKQFPIVQLSPDQIRVDPRNVYRHSDAEIQRLVAVVGEHGNLSTIAVDAESMRIEDGRETFELVGGEARLEAYKSLAVETIPAIMATFETPAQRSAAAIALNGNFGSFDNDALTAMLEELNAQSYDLDSTGLEPFVLSELLGEPPFQGQTDPDDVPEPPTEAITQRGDLILLGDHRLICADCRDATVLDRLFGETKANVVVTSPPYAKQRDYDESSGFRPVPPDEYSDWFESVARGIWDHLADDGSYFLNIKEHCEGGQRHLYVKKLTVTHVEDWGWRLVDEFCWQRPSPPGRWPNRFKNNWEPIFHFSRSERIRFRPEAVGHGSDYLPVKSSKVGADKSGPNGEYWNLSGQTEKGTALPGNVIHASGVEPGTGHVAAYPAALPEFFIKAFSDENDVIFDPFMGSGTTLIAAEQNKRVAYGCEISPAYCDVICERFSRLTGTAPIRPARGKIEQAVS